MVGHAADAVRSIIAEGVEKAMTKYNRRAQGLNNRGRMRIYEELFIIKPDAPEEEVDPFIEQMRTSVDHRRRHGGQSGKVGQAQAGLPGG